MTICTRIPIMGAQIPGYLSHDKCLKKVPQNFLGCISYTVGVLDVY